jgi:hypothetical protein
MYMHKFFLCQAYCLCQAYFLSKRNHQSSASAAIKQLKEVLGVPGLSLCTSL